MATRRNSNSRSREWSEAESQDTSLATYSTRHPRVRAREGEPPLYRVDLSLPPESRYNRICDDYKSQMIDLVGIYDELLSFTHFPRLLGFLAKNLLRRVRSEEETREIKGISLATGIPVYLLVAFNTFLDLFSGCMSGGAQVKLPRMPRETRMIHFRNLDWAMDPLRNMIIRVEYVIDGTVIAR